ncbi:MAG: LacI family DNA-binding transcriptional regulator [Opitutales bacterium]|nr:LacI family DNA-binding transcriptional regulator [Opitutales bacterium]
MRVTQKSIADKIGVSVSLVCRVLSGRADEIGVAEETRKRVMETAEEMGYVPNLAAQTLRGKPSRTVGVVVYDFQDSFFSDLVGHLQRIVHSAGYSTVIVGFTDREIDTQDLSPLLQRALDAVIVVGSDLTGNVFERLKHVPVFRIGVGFPGESTICYTADEERAASELASYLKERQVANVMCVRHVSPILERRIEGMRRALEGAGLRVESIVAPKGLRNFEAGFWMATEHLKPNALPDAVVCAIDLIALGVIHGALSRRIRIPDQLKVTGFDDIAVSRQIYPPITTFAQPVVSIVERIVERIGKGDFEIGVEYVYCPLLRRLSC